MFVVISKQDKKIEELYRKIASEIGLSASAFWSLYGICETGEVLTQITLADRLSLPKQTINSAIVGLVNDGLVELKPMTSAKNSKAVTLTEKGKKFCEMHIIPVLEAEDEAYSKLTEQEIIRYIELCHKQYELLSSDLGSYLENLKAEKTTNE